MIQDYIDHGWGLCAIKPHTKQPHGDDWQNKPLTGPPADGYGVGVIHRLSGTCAIDLDDVGCSRIALEALGINLDDLMRDGLQIHSREGRGKLLFQTPASEMPEARHNLNWPKKDGGFFCVLEFRAGDVQDILPPSIHPDTKEPYTWGGDWRNLPELPDKLAQVWREWELAKSAMMDACPWREIKVDARVARAPLVKRAHDGGGVIGAYNDAHHPAELLEARGYRPAGRRWLSPHSTTGIPGVILLPDSEPPAIFCHHASDPLADEHKHDAFSLYTQLEHGGDLTAAIKEAAQALGIEREEDKEGVQIAERLLESNKSKAQLSVVSSPKRKQPEKINAPHPGKLPVPQLREIENLLKSRIHAYKQDAVTQAALSFACAITARRYVTHNGQPTTTFFGVTDTSTAGLRPMKGALYNLSDELGERAAIRGTKLPSSGVFYQAMLSHPRMYWVTDEYGHLVQMARRQQSGALESAIAVLHEAHTGQTLFIDRDTATTGKPRDLKESNIYDPTVTLLALLAQDQLAALGSRSEYGRGTLQQMLICPAGEGTQDKKEESSKEVGESLVEWVKRLQSIPGVAGAEQVATMPAQTTKVHMEQDAEGEIAAGVLRMQAFMAAEPEREVYRGMVKGCTYSAVRLAASLSAWSNPDEPVMVPEIARWAILWAERCLIQTVPRLVITAQDTDEPDTTQRVMQVLFDSERPMAAREIARKCRAFRRLSSEERDDMLGKLVEDGYCSTQKKGRTFFYHSLLQTQKKSDKVPDK